MGIPYYFSGRLALSTVSAIGKRVRPEFAKSGTEADFGMSCKGRYLHPEVIYLRPEKPNWTFSNTRVKKKCKLTAVRAECRLR